MISEIQIDRPLLIRKVPLLALIQKRQYTWNEIGENLLGQPQKSRTGRQESSGFKVDRTPAATVTAQSAWTAVKGEMFQLLATESPELEGIRKRLVGAGNSSTLYILSTLSLWLAGTRGLSVSITTPVVATILYAIADSPSGFAVLQEG